MIDCADSSGSCDNGLEKYGPFCYRKCTASYIGIAHKCYEKCPDGMKDWGFSCKGEEIIPKSSYTRVSVNEVHDWCYEDYPELNGLLCYPRCKPGYYGVGPVCWGTCPPQTHFFGAVCIKDTYTRGAGNVLSYCPPDKVKSGGFCYPKCKSGYYGVGPVCWEYCKSGYTDTGVFCSKGWHTYAKDSYGRGWGHALWCKPEEEQDGLLCYPKCKTGYDAVAFVCWGTCKGSETADTGTQCQKLSYGRGFGKPINCFVPPKRSDIANWQGLVDILKNIHKGFTTLKTVGCAELYIKVKPWITIGKSLNGCLRKDEWTTVIVSFNLDIAVGVTGGMEVGVAFDAQIGKGLCFEGWCGGAKSDISFGGSFAIGYWRSLNDVSGESLALEVGGDAPGTEIGVSLVFMFVDKIDLIGVEIQFGVGVGLSPVDVGLTRCTTPSSQTIEITV